MSYVVFSGSRWREISSIKNANVFGIVDPPDGFIPWAKKHGAIEVAPKEPGP